MGLDFITVKAKAFKKAWNGSAAALGAPDLFSPEETWDEQLVLFDVHEGWTLLEGEELVVQIGGTTLVALRGTAVVATAGSPPESVMVAVRRARGYVLGRVARFSAVSRTADLAFRLH
jgi:hypothetical protein